MAAPENQYPFKSLRRLSTPESEDLATLIEFLEGLEILPLQDYRINGRFLIRMRDHLNTYAEIYRLGVPTPVEEEAAPGGIYNRDPRRAQKQPGLKDSVG